MAHFMIFLTNVSHPSGVRDRYLVITCINCDYTISNFKHASPKNVMTNTIESQVIVADSGAELRDNVKFGSIFTLSV